MAAMTKVLCAAWQRYRARSRRNILAHAGKGGRRGAPAFIATAFAQDTVEAARSPWRAVTGQIRARVPKLANIRDDADHGVPACMTFPTEQRATQHSTDPIERLNGGIKRRTDVVGAGGNTIPRVVS